MPVEQVIRELLKELQSDPELLRMVADGRNPEELSSGDLVGLANRLWQLLAES